MMKRWMAVFGTLVVSTVASATSIELPFLQYDRAPIGPHGGEQVSVRVLADGQVHGYRSRALFPGQWRHLGTVPPFEMQRLRELVRRAERARRLVAPVAPFVNCAAMPSHRDVYQAPQNRLVLEENTNPCGSVRYNDTRSAYEVVQFLNTYRDRLFRP
jgi:hypothetical protein